MSDQALDPRFESLLREALVAEVAKLPLTVGPDQIVERARVRDGARVGSRLRPLLFREPNSGLMRLSLAIGSTAIALMIVVVGAALLRGLPSQPGVGAPSPDPTPSPQNSPRSGEPTFTSTIHGISIDYPSAWQTRPATEAWTGGELSFDSPAADVIFDPTRGDRLYLVLASQPTGLNEAAWRESVLAWTCPRPPDAGGEVWGWTIDGVYSWQQGPCNSGSLVVTGTRGYLIRLVAASYEPGLAATYDWDWLVPLLETVDLRPEEALDAPGREPLVPGHAPEP